MEIINNSINLYPYNISFNHDKKKVFYSICGLILSGFSYLIIFFLIHHYSIDLLNKKNPIVKISQLIINDTFKFSLDSIIESVSLNLTIEFNINETIINEKIFNQSLKFIIERNKLDEDNTKQDYFYTNDAIISSPKILDLKKNSFSYNLNLEITNETDFIYTNNLDTLEKLNSSIKMKDIDFPLKNHDIMLFYEYEKPKNVGNFTIKNVNITYVIKDNIVNTDNFTNFFTTIPNFGNLKNGECLSLTYRAAELITDKNPLFYKDFAYYVSQIDFYFLKTNRFESFEIFSNGKLIEIQFRQIMYVYSRKFKTILDVFSELAGMFTPILKIGNFLVFKFNEKKFKIHILNKLFTDEDINGEFKKSQKINDNNEIDKRKVTHFKNSNLLNDENFILRGKEDIKINLRKNYFIKKNFEMKDLSDIQRRIQIKKMKNDTSRVLICRKNLSIEDSPKQFLIRENLNNPNSINVKNIKNDSSELNMINPLLTINRDISEYKNNQKEILRQKEDLNLEEENTNNKIRSKNEVKDKKNKINEEIETKKIKKQHLLDYSFKNLIVSLICNRNLFYKDLIENEEIYNKIIHKLDFYFEITNLMKLYENFEKMKFILFNRNQMNCFNYMIHDISSDYNKNEEEILNELSEYFKKTSINNFENYMNESIKTIMKDEIKKIIIKE